MLEKRQMHQNNIQLHKDLGREQLIRRKLHNELEDMKGKIRVYVRIRPFSKKEMEMGCTEAVMKVRTIQKSCCFHDCSCVVIYMRKLLHPESIINNLFCM